MLIGLTGKMQSGKSTVAQYLVEKYGYTELPLADPVKEMALALDPIITWGWNAELMNDQAYRLSDFIERFGWDEAKRDPEVRRLLQRLGTEAGRGVLGEDVWIDHLYSRIDAHVTQNWATAKEEGLEPDYWKELDVVVPDVRFPNEAEYVREGRMGKSGIVIEIRREQPDRFMPTESQRHASENGEIRADVIIENTSSLGTLYSMVDNALANLTRQRAA